MENGSGKLRFIEKRVRKIFCVALALFSLATYNAFAVEKSFGIELGEKIHCSEGTPYNAHSLAISLDFSGENFGFKPFFGFSFSTIKEAESQSGSPYNYKTTTAVETLGMKPYFIFKKTERSENYIGILFALNFNQRTVNTEASSSAEKAAQTYVTGEFGLFVGKRWHATEKMSIFAECDLSSRLFSSTSKYKVNGIAVLSDYQSSMFGGGGTSAWALFVTPRLGMAWKL